MTTSLHRTASGRITKPARRAASRSARRSVYRTARRAASSSARPIGLNNMPSPQIGSILNHLNGTELARMKTVSRRYRNYINAHPALSARVNLARRKSISRGHTLTEMRLTNGTMFHLNQVNKNRFMNRIMALPGNNHPLSRANIRRHLFMFFH